jgi:hypothetical protein
MEQWKTLIPPPIGVGSQHFLVSKNEHFPQFSGPSVGLHYGAEYCRVPDVQEGVSFVDHALFTPAGSGMPG